MGAVTSVGIVDYGMGNVQSVWNALEHLGARVQLLESPDDRRGVDRVVLPGVGAFGVAMANLRRRGWDDGVREHVGGGRPFLGVCLGLQLLADRGVEDGDHEGLGLLPGVSRRLTAPQGVRMPHIGWNEVRPIRTDGIVADVSPGTCFYFVHSYVLTPSDPSAASAVTEYGGSEFVSVVEVDNIVATQFHPEKSQKAGLELLRRFLAS